MQSEEQSAIDQIILELHDRLKALEKENERLATYETQTQVRLKRIEDTLARMGVQYG